MDYAVIPEIGRLELWRKPVPQPEDYQVIVKVRLCGICGTDLQILAGSFPVSLPYSPGHEVVGEVAGLGRKVEGLQVGDRVAVDPNYSCGTCFHCAHGRPNHCLNRRTAAWKSNGGFAEYCAVPRLIVHRLPLELGWREAVLVEPLSCALHVLDEAAIASAEAVLLIGCGTMGLLSLLLARQRKVGTIIVSEPVAKKRELAARLGASIVWDPANGPVSVAVLEATVHGAQVAVDNVGMEQTINEGLHSLRPGGTLILAGVNSNAHRIPISPIETTERELHIRGAFLNPGTFPRALEKLCEIRQECADLVTHQFPLAEVFRAYEVARCDDAIKVVVGQG